jgi:hypothetical protein
VYDLFLETGIFISHWDGSTRVASFLHVVDDEISKYSRMSYASDNCHFVDRVTSDSSLHVKITTQIGALRSP